MWRLAHSIETNASPEAIWRRWVDVETWPEWDDAIQAAHVKGADVLGLGSKAVLYYIKGIRLKFRVVKAVHGRMLICRGWRLGLCFSLEHSLQPTRLGAKITHCLVVNGPLAWLFQLTLGKHLACTLPRATRKLAQIA